MNDDLKAYVDGELPPGAAERLRARMDADPALALEGEEFRRLAAALRSLPEPMPVGKAMTLEALASRRPLWRGWAVALAGCAAVLAAVSTLPPRAASASAVQPAVFRPGGASAPSEERGFEGETASGGVKIRTANDAPPAPRSAPRLEKPNGPPRKGGGPRRNGVRGPKAG